MKKEMNLIYKPVAEINTEETQRRVEAAFDMLFDEIFAQEDSNVGRRIPNNLARTYGMEVVGNG